MSQQFCLKWNNHMNNMMDVFKNLLSAESMVDVTLACDGLSLKAHKMVLSACSPFFQSLFSENPCKHPIVILKDMKYTELKAIIEFMYHGEVNVAQDQLSALMKTAETLRVKGLAEVTNEKSSQSNTSQDEPVHRTQTRTDTPPPSNKRRRGRTRKRSLSDSNRSDDDSNEPKIKPPMSPEIEELSADVAMDASNSQFSSLQSQMPMQSTSSHSSNSFHKSSSVINQEPQIEEPVSADEGEFGVEPAKLLEQTLTTEELNARRNRASNIELQRRSRSSADHSTIVPTSMSSDTSNQQPDSPIDVKPEILDLDPPMSPVAGPSHSTDNSMMMYMDQSSVSSHPGPSGYQDNTALVPQESQQGNVRYESRRDRGPQGAPPEILAFLNRPGLTITEASGSKKVAEAPRTQSRNVAEARSELIITETSSSKNDSLYHCEFCNYQTTSIQRLQNHLEEHKSSRSQCCNVCGKVFRNLSSLQNHMASHDPSRSFTCMYCEKQFKHQSSLKSHMKTHFNYEQKCPICDKVLPSESAFKKHMLSHQLQ